MRICTEEVKIGDLVVSLEKSDGRHSIKLVASLEEGDLEDEEVANKAASELLDERASGCR